MLTLTRHAGESIVVTTPEGREIVIILTQSNHGRARIAIQADADVSIVREELTTKNGGTK